MSYCGRPVQGRNCRVTCNEQVLMNRGQKGWGLLAGHGQNKVHSTRDRKSLELGGAAAWTETPPVFLEPQVLLSQQNCSG